MKKKFQKTAAIFISACLFVSMGTFSGFAYTGGRSEAGMSADADKSTGLQTAGSASAGSGLKGAQAGTDYADLDYVTSVEEVEGVDPATLEDTSLEYNGFPVYRGFVKISRAYDSDSDPYCAYFYSDGYFKETAEDAAKGLEANSSTVYNEHLATMSCALSMSANHTKYNVTSGVKDIMEDIGCSSITANEEYTEGTTGRDTFGVACGSKTLFEETADECKLIVVALRGAFYQQEWASNLTIGTEGDAAGFTAAAQKAYDYVDQYIADNTDYAAGQKVKIWITGGSRGGAVADMAGAKLTDKYGADSVYAYALKPAAGAYAGTDRSSGFAEGQPGSYKNVHCVCNYNDGITMVAPFYTGGDTDMKFSHYGQVHYLGQNYDLTTGKKLKDFATSEAEMLTQLKSTEEALYSEYVSPSDFTWAKLNEDGSGSSSMYGSYINLEKIKGLLSNKKYDTVADIIADYPILENMLNKSSSSSGADTYMMAAIVKDSSTDNIASERLFLSTLLDDRMSAVFKDRDEYAGNGQDQEDIRAVKAAAEALGLTVTVTSENDMVFSLLDPENYPNNKDVTLTPENVITTAVETIIKYYGDISDESITGIRSEIEKIEEPLMAVKTEYLLAVINYLTTGKTGSDTYSDYASIVSQFWQLIDTESGDYKGVTNILKEYFMAQDTSDRTSAAKALEAGAKARTLVDYVKAYLSISAYYITQYVSNDYVQSQKGSGQVVATLVYNLTGIAHRHYAGTTAAWLRSEDSFYQGETTAAIPDRENKDIIETEICGFAGGNTKGISLQVIDSNENPVAQVTDGVATAESDTVVVHADSDRIYIDSKIEESYRVEVWSDSATETAPSKLKITRKNLGSDKYEMVYDMEGYEKDAACLYLYSDQTAIINLSGQVTANGKLNGTVTTPGYTSVEKAINATVTAMPSGQVAGTTSAIGNTDSIGASAYTSLEVSLKKSINTEDVAGWEIGGRQINPSDLTGSRTFTVETGYATPNVTSTVYLKTDLSGVKWNYTASKVYTGKKISVSLKSIPAGFTAVYTGNTKKAVGTYTARVTFKAKDDKYATKGSPKTLTWKIIPKKAAVSKLAIGKKKSRKLTISMSSKASATGGSGYEYSYKVKGSSKWTTRKTTGKTITLKKLKKGKKYCVKARAYKKVKGKYIYGAWSATKTSKAIR